MWLVVLMVEDGSKDCSIDVVISLSESSFDRGECLLTASEMESDPCTSDVQTVHLKPLISMHSNRPWSFSVISQSSNVVTLSRLIAQMLG